MSPILTALLIAAVIAALLITFWPNDGELEK